MINTLKSMGQSVQSLGNKALAHPHWAGKTGFAALTVTLVVLCGIAAVIGAVLYLMAAIFRRTNKLGYDDDTDDRTAGYHGGSDDRPYFMYDVEDARSVPDIDD